MALALYAVLGQPAELGDRIKRRRRRSQRPESDALSSLLCHANTHSNVSFSPCRRGRESPQRELSEWILCLPLSFLNSALTDSSLIEIHSKINLVMRSDFICILIPLMWGRVNMCLFLPFPLKRLQWMEEICRKLVFWMSPVVVSLCLRGRNSNLWLLAVASIGEIYASCKRTTKIIVDNN